MPHPLDRLVRHAASRVPFQVKDQEEQIIKTFLQVGPDLLQLAGVLHHKSPFDQVTAIRPFCFLSSQLRRRGRHAGREGGQRAQPQPQELRYGGVQLALGCPWTADILVTPSVVDSQFEAGTSMLPWSMMV